MIDIELTVLGFTGLLIVGSLLSPLAERLNLPYTVLLAAMGCALGAISVLNPQIVPVGLLPDFMRAIGNFGFSAEVLLYVFLPTLLFEAAVTIDIRRLMDDVVPILLLAVVAVVICTAAVGFALAAVSGLGLVVCLLIGAIVSPTDAGSVVGIFRDIGAPRRLRILVEGESLFNDAAALVIVGLLLALLREGLQPDLATATWDFLTAFGGGAAVGYALGRAACALVPVLRGSRVAEINLTVALAYLAFVLAERYLHVSGVVAVVSAALVVGSCGRTQISPNTWDSLVETWHQMGYWANSLIFLLAAMLIPRLVFDFGVNAIDLYLLGAVIVAALAARAVVLYGLLPALSGLGLAQKVSGPYKAVILWGGLRGTISLTIALAAIDTPMMQPEIRHAVALLTTGFVLFTLVVNGTTLRLLIRVLGVDRLSPADRALRDRVLVLSLASINDRVASTARNYRLDPSAAMEVASHYRTRLNDAEAMLQGCAQMPKADRLYIGLSMLASHEEELYLRHFREGTISRRVVRSLVAQTGRLLDGVKAGGREGYESASNLILAFSPGFRLALEVQRRLGLTGMLAEQLADRFEILLVIRWVVREDLAHNDNKVTALLDRATADQLHEVLSRRLESTNQALEALRLQYPDYARTLESGYLGRAALSLEEPGYRQMLSDSVISQDVFNDLEQAVLTRRQVFDRRPRLDLGIDTVALIARVPLFAGLETTRCAEIATMLRPRIAVPGETIVTAGEPGDAMYFISSGAVEVIVRPNPVRLGNGDFFGEIALLTNKPRSASVRALGYCKLLELRARDFRWLLGENASLSGHIRRVAGQRQDGNAARAS